MWGGSVGVCVSVLSVTISPSWSTCYNSSCVPHQSAWGVMGYEDVTLGSLRNMMQRSLWGRVWGKVWGSLWGRVWGRAWNMMQGRVRGRVWFRVRGRVRGCKSRRQG